VARAEQYQASAGDGTAAVNVALATIAAKNDFIEFSLQHLLGQVSSTKSLASASASWSIERRLLEAAGGAHANASWPVISSVELDVESSVGVLRTAA
jgi:hypothetical protein